MQLVTRKRSVVAGLLGGALLLGACGAGGGSHVVRPQDGVGTGVGVSAPVSTTTAAIASTAPAVSSRNLSQIDAELGALDTTLSQANTDINSPQGDS